MLCNAREGVYGPALHFHVIIHEKNITQYLNVPNSKFNVFLRKQLHDRSFVMTTQHLNIQQFNAELVGVLNYIT